MRLHQVVARKNFSLGELVFSRHVWETSPDSWVTDFKYYCNASLDVVQWWDIQWKLLA